MCPARQLTTLGSVRLGSHGYPDPPVPPTHPDKLPHHVRLKLTTAYHGPTTGRLHQQFRADTIPYASDEKPEDTAQHEPTAREGVNLDKIGRHDRLPDDAILSRASECPAAFEPARLDVCAVRVVAETSRANGVSISVSRKSL